MKTYLVIYDNQAREISRIPLPKFTIEAWQYVWAARLFARRRKVDNRCDHWDLIKLQQ